MGTYESVGVLLRGGSQSIAPVVLYTEELRCGAWSTRRVHGSVAICMPLLTIAGCQSPPKPGRNDATVIPLESTPKLYWLVWGWSTLSCPDLLVSYVMFPAKPPFWSLRSSICWIWPSFKWFSDAGRPVTLSCLFCLPRTLARLWDRKLVLICFGSWAISNWRWMYFRWLTLRRLIFCWLRTLLMVAPTFSINRSRCPGFSILKITATVNQ